MKKIKNKKHNFRSLRLPMWLSVFILTGSILTFVVAKTSAIQSTVDTHIIYSTKQGSDSMQIWKMDLDGSNPTQLTNDQMHEQEWARPSPDGTKIIYTKADKGVSINFSTQTNSLWMMNIDGTNQHEIISIAKRNQYNWTGQTHPEWSPDSDKILLVATLPTFTSQLFVVDLDGNNPEQITQTTTIGGQSANVLDPSWSKTNQIVYARQWGCFVICSNQDIFSMDYVSRQETRITNDAHWNYDPYLSPDGTTYLWLSFRDSAILCPCDMIKGSATGPLNPTPVIADGGSNANGTFSSDSSQILFLKQVDTRQVLHRINLDGTGLTSIGINPLGESGIGSFVPQITSGDNGGGDNGGGDTGGGDTGGGDNGGGDTGGGDNGGGDNGGGDTGGGDTGGGDTGGGDNGGGDTGGGVPISGEAPNQSVTNGDTANAGSSSDSAQPGGVKSSITTPGSPQAGLAPSVNTLPRRAFVFAIGGILGVGIGNGIILVRKKYLDNF